MVTARVLVVLSGSFTSQIETGPTLTLRINTVVILLGDVIRGNPRVVQAEMEGCKI